jgi:hypothetical protein
MALWRRKSMQCSVAEVNHHQVRNEIWWLTIVQSIQFLLIIIDVWEVYVLIHVLMQAFLLQNQQILEIQVENILTKQWTS